MNPEARCCRCAEPDVFPMRPHFRFKISLNNMWQRDVTVCQRCSSPAILMQIFYPVCDALVASETKSQHENERVAALDRKRNV